MAKEAKRLYRSEEDRMIGGVCGGLADHLEIDPVLVRVLAIVFLFMGGGFLAYIILWIVIPTKSDVVKPKKASNKKK